MRTLPLLLVLLFASPALAEDPCEGRNPLYCAPQPGPLVCGYERVKPEGSIATTSDYVCRRDGQVVFVRKGKDNNWNISDVREREDYR